MLRQQVKARLAGGRLKQVLAQRYTAQRRVHGAIVSGRNQVAIQGHTYTAAGLGEATHGARVEVVNAGRPAAAVYVPLTASTKIGGTAATAAPTASPAASDCYSKSDYIAISDGTVSAKHPILLGADGKLDGSMLDPADVDHELIANRGTSTHVEIDDHLADTVNPHDVTYTQTGAAPASHSHGPTELEGIQLNDLEDVDASKLDGHTIWFVAASNRWQERQLPTVVEDLEDVDLSSLQDGDNLAYDAQNQIWHNAAPVDQLDELNDVELLNPLGQDLLLFDAATQTWTNWPWPHLADLDDVDRYTPGDGNVLTYDTQAQHWTPAPPEVGVVVLDDLDDVELTSPQAGQILRHMGSQWQNVTPSKRLNLGAAQTLAVSSDTVTLPADGSYFLLQCEDGLDDDLATIAGTYSEGDVILVQKTGAGTLTVVETGNIAVEGAVLLDHGTDTLTLVYGGSVGKWCEVSFTSNG